MEMFLMESLIKGFVTIVACIVISSPIGAEQPRDARPANAGSASAGSADADSEARHFTLKVLPLLKDKCLGCHGADPEDIKGGYDARSREAVIKGGESEEAAIIPGNPDESPFYQAVTWEGLEMPPKENDRLSGEQTQWIRRWIEAVRRGPMKRPSSGSCRPSKKWKKMSLAS